MSGSQSFLSLPSAPLLWIYVPIFVAACCFLLGLGISRRSASSDPPIVKSPRSTLLPKLSQEEIAELPYPPDIFPGGRYVETPYGSTRTYEWGPEDGRKVLFVPGISTPCIALGPLAERLVARGCRVMLFDLLGRGYSDSPLGLEHSSQLFNTQILHVLASSPLRWVDSSKGGCINLIGYSLGGGIAASFARYFTHLVRSLTLIASGGIIRETHVGWRSRLLYSKGLFPKSLLHFLTWRRLKPTLPTVVAVAATDTGMNADNEAEKSPSREGLTDLRHPSSKSVASEVINFNEAMIVLGGDGMYGGTGVRKAVSVGSVVLWQLQHHDGFIPAFISSMRHGPIYREHATWAVLGARWKSCIRANATGENHSENVAGEGEYATPQHRSKTILFVFGSLDTIVLKEEVATDAEKILGREIVETAVLEGGHELPITKPEDVAQSIWQYWEGA